MKVEKSGFLNQLILVVILLNYGISAYPQGTLVDFSTIPKSGTILVYSHMDDDLIWMLPFWQKSEKFIGGAMPATPSYRTIISQQQAFLNTGGYNISYESNWFTPWDDITDTEYTEYYWADNPSYSYLLNDHLETRLYDNTTELSSSEIDKIKAKLEQYFASPGMSRVITHNNWGEYGHKHHVGLNKAVRELAVKYRKDVWMLGCDNGGFNDVDVPEGITFTYGSFNQPELYTGIRDIYVNNDRWTWYTDRIPSGDHKFIKIVEGGSDKSNILNEDEITYPGPSQLEPGAYIFDGDDDYMTLPGNNNSSFTIAMRIRPVELKEMDISCMAEYPGSTRNDRNIYLNSDGKIVARIFDGSSRIIVSENAVQSGNWSHVAITCTGSTFKLYLNGLPEGTISTGTAITDFSTPEFVLGVPAETGSYFDGQVSDVRFYSSALTDQEIAGISGMVRTITSGSGPGGRINPEGSTDVVLGTDITYTLIPDTGSGISDVLADGISVGAVSSYTFTNVTQNHTISASFYPLASFTIMASAGSGGTIAPSGEVTVYEGTDQVFTIEAGLGFRVAEVRVDDVPAGAAIPSYTFSNISAGHTISATFEPVPTYNIITTAGTGGSIIPGGTIAINEGSGRTFTISPDAAYRIEDVLVDNISVGAVATYSFSNVMSDHTISATFSVRTYTLTASPGSNGSINPAGVVTKNYGENQSYTITPATGYRISNVMADNVSVGTPSSYTFSSIHDDHTIQASFSIITNTIEATAGTGGSITPNGSVPVNYGSNRSFTVTPLAGYRIADVLIDNVSAGAVSTYTFNNVTSGHNITASFTPITWTISGSASSGGSINPTGAITVNQGSARTFTITPSYGFQIADVRIDNASVGAVNSYTFSNVTSDHTISASFETATYSITAGGGTGGSISPSGVASVQHGSDRTYTITPETGFRISDVIVDNQSVGAVSSYTFNNISANHTISAAYSIITYTVSASAGNGGSVTPAGNLTVNYGTSRTFSITPDQGYYITDVKIDNVSAGPITTHTFSNITGNHTISASFALFTYSITTSAGTGGSIDPGGILNVTYGSDITVSVSPDEGYLISDVLLDDVTIGKVTSYTFRNVVSNHRISATFTRVVLTVKGSAGPGGSITSSGTQNLPYGSDITFTVIPETGYEIADVIVDNNSVGPVYSYTFSNIKKDHVISASFRVITYTIAESSTEGGSVSPSGNVTVAYGEKQTFEITANPGFKITDVNVDNSSIGIVDAYSFDNVIADHSISVTFKPKENFRIVAGAGTGGSITPSGASSFEEGTTDLTYLIIPDYGYRILDVIVDDQSAGPVTEYKFNGLASDHNIMATFSATIDIEVYPNPFTEEFSIGILAPGDRMFEARVADLSGRIIYVREGIPGNEVSRLRIPGTKGMYILRLYLDGVRVASFRIIKI